MIRALAVNLLALLALSIVVGPASAAPSCEQGETRSLALLSARTGRVERDYPGIGGVLVALADGHGGWFPGPSCFVDALALDGPRLFVGGDAIATIGGQKRPGFAELDARTGALALWVPGAAPRLNPGFGVGDVETILVAHGTVFSAGHDGFGITDERTGAIAPLMRSVKGAYRFAASGSTAYLGGNLRNSLSVTGKIGNNLAAVDLATGRVKPWAPNLDTYVDVTSIAASPTRVLVAGDFSRSLG